MSNEGLPSSANDPLIGTVIADRYRVFAPLGEGGMGMLYLARHQTLKKDFVVKIIRTDGMAMSSKVYLSRFRREAKAVALVNHPHVVKVVDFDILNESMPYIIMEFVEGVPLKEFMTAHPSGLPIPHVLSFMKQLCGAVSAIHKAGIIHRDLKPSNVMVQETEDDYILTIIDFGLVHATQAEIETGKIKLTKTGQILGSPFYMSPEQCRGIEVEERSDVYALGLIAYELVTGMQAVDGRGLLDIVRRQIMESPEPIQDIRSNVPPAMVAAIGKALEKKPEARFASPRLFYEAMSEKFLDRSGTMPIYRPAQESQESPQTSKARPGWLTALLVLAVIAVAVIGFLLLR